MQVCRRWFMGITPETELTWRNKTMKIVAVGLVIVSSLIIGRAAVAATTDDVKWINQCVSDNKDEGAKKEVVLKYCTCMDNKMSNNETQSITQWEKTHVAERKACDAESGWK